MIADDPMTVYQDFLDVSSRQIVDGRFAEVAAGMVYPQVMETADGALRFDGPDAMEVAARDFAGFLRGIGMTDYHRICDWAEKEGDVITGEHTTYIVKGASFAVPPYRNRMWLRQQDSAWRGAGVAAAVSNRTCTILSPVQLRAARGPSQ